MKIVETIDETSIIPIIARSTYLNNQTGVKKVGYFVDGDLILPFVIRQKWCLHWMQLYTEVLNCNSQEMERQFLNGCMSMVKQKFKISHVMTSNTSIFKSFPNGSEYCKFGTYIVDLTLDKETLFANIHPKHRNKIRRAENLGLKVSHGKEFAKDVTRLMSDTYSRQGLKFTFGDAYIANLNKLGDNVDWWIVQDYEGTIHGAAIFLWSEGTSCYYIHGGSGSHTAPGAMNFLIWKAMIEMKLRGVHYFDFVGARITTEKGSKLEGIQHFKSRFGSTMLQGYMFRFVVSPFYYFVFKSLLRLFYRLHGRWESFDIIEQERKKGNY